MSKMRPEVKEVWINNLLSGKYHQVQGTLADEDSPGRCCLGVLCDTKAQITHKKVWGKDVNKREGFLDDPILKWAGLDDETQRKLAAFNDDGKSFKWIAAYIKRYL